MWPPGWPTRSVSSHKWQAAVWVVAGGPGMGGAAALACGGAQRGGAGYVRLSSPGRHEALGAVAPVEVVQHRLAGADWAPEVLGDLDRFGALVIGNGLGTDDATRAQIRAVLAAPDEVPVLTVVDADGLTALGQQADGLVGPHTILTPHDGEFARLAGGPPGPDRLGAARGLAEQLGCVVLLKGGPTVVAGPDGACPGGGHGRRQAGHRRHGRRAGRRHRRAGRPRPGSLAGRGRRSVPARHGRRPRLA